MMVCPQCSAEMAEGSLFCSQCGAPAPPTQAPAMVDAPPPPEAVDADPVDVPDDPTGHWSQRAPEAASEQAEPADPSSTTEPSEPTDPAAVSEQATPSAPTKPVRGRRLTTLARVGLLLATLLGLANLVFAGLNILDGGLGHINDWFSSMSDNLPVVSASILTQIFLAVLAVTLSFFRRAWLHPLFFIVCLVAAQFARGVRGSSFDWDQTMWSDPHQFQDFNTASQLWFWLPSMMIAAMLIYWIGWKMGRPRATQPAPSRDPFDRPGGEVVRL